METKELLLQLIKKMESGEIIASGDGGEKLFLIDKVSKVEICVGEAEIIEDKYASPGIGKIKYLENNEDNDNFKENFYREKGVKCWIPNCQNKILQKEGDHKKVKIPCQESHTRMVCLECSKKHE